MSITITEDIAGGVEVLDGIDGRIVVRQLLVSGLDHTDNWPIYDRVFTDQTADGQTVPFPGDAYPGMTGYYLERRTAAPYLDSTDTMRVRLEYRDLRYARIGINGSTVRDMTRFDAAGQRLLVKFKSENSGWPTTGETASAEAPVLIPHSIVDFDVFDIGVWADPFPFEYAGAINSDDFQGFPRHTWLCLGISGGPWSAHKLTANPIYRRRYSFEYMGIERGGVSTSWDPLLWFRTPTRPIPPAEIDPYADGFRGGYVTSDGSVTHRGNGWTQVQIQHEMPFNALKLPSLWGIGNETLRDGT